MKQWDIAPKSRTKKPAPHDEDHSFLEPIEKQKVVPKNRSGRWLYLIVALLAIIFLLLLYVAVRGERTVVVPAPQVTVTAPSTTAETFEPPISSLPETKEEESSPPEVVISDVSVRVLNGNGQAGAAAKVRDILSEAGFTVTSIGNSTPDFDKTTVYYKEDDLAAAELVKDFLLDYQTELLENADLVGSEARILVVVGKT